MKAAGMGESINRILIIRFRSLGDVVLATGLFETIAGSSKPVEIDFATQATYQGLLAAHPRIRLLTYSASGDSAPGFGRLLKRIISVRYDAVFDLQGNSRSLITALAGAPARVYRYGKGHLERRRFVRKKSFSEPYIHTVERYCRAFRKAGISCSPVPPRLHLGGDSLRFAESFLASQGIRIDEAFLVVCPGARYRPKQWGREKYEELAKSVTIRLGLKVIWVADPVGHGDEMTAPGVSTLRRSDPAEVAAVIARARAFVGNDTGLMHVAQGVKTPVVAVFGPTHPCLGFYPLGEYDRIVSTYQDCSPCSLHGERECYRDRRYCMEDLAVGTVLAELEDVLSKTADEVTDA